MLYAKCVQVCLLFIALTPCVSTTTDCAYFQFEHRTVQGDTLNAVANTTVNVTFSLRNKNCTDLENTVIVINRLSDKDQPQSPLCVLKLKNGTCLSVLSRQVTCSCDSNNGQYRFLKTVGITDAGTWMWTTIDGRASTQVSFNIANVSGLSLTSSKYKPDLLSTLDRANATKVPDCNNTLHPEPVLFIAACLSGACNLAAVLACVLNKINSKKRRKMVRASKTSYLNAFDRMRVRSQSKRLESDRCLQQVFQMVRLPTGNMNVTPYQHATQTSYVRQSIPVTSQLSARQTSSRKECYDVTGVNAQATTVNLDLDGSLLSENSLDLPQKEDSFYYNINDTSDNNPEQESVIETHVPSRRSILEQKEENIYCTID